MNVMVTCLFFAGGSNHLGTSSFISAEWWIVLPIVHDLSDQVFLSGPWPSHSRPLGPDAQRVLDASQVSVVLCPVVSAFRDELTSPSQPVKKGIEAVSDSEVPILSYAGPDGVVWFC